MRRLIFAIGGLRLTRRFAAPLPSVASRNLQAVMPIAEVMFS